MEPQRNILHFMRDFLVTFFFFSNLTVCVNENTFIMWFACLWDPTSGWTCLLVMRLYIKLCSLLFMQCSQTAEAKLNGILAKTYLSPTKTQTHTHYWLNEDSFTFTPQQQTDRGDADKELKMSRLIRLSYVCSNTSWPRLSVLKLTGISKWQTSGEKAIFSKARGQYYFKPTKAEYTVRVK